MIKKNSDNAFFMDIYGAKVALYPMKSVKTVVLKSEIYAGSWFEKKRWGGVHLMEHMLHHGTRKWKTKDEFEFFKEENGIYQNAYTSGLAMGIDINGPSASLTNMLQVWEEVSFFPRIPEDKLENEKKVVLQEYRDIYSSPNARFWKASNKFLYGDHVYTHHPIGEPEFIKSFSVKDLVQIQKKYTSTDNLNIVIVGNINPEDVALRLKAILKDKRRGKMTPTNFPEAQCEGKYMCHLEDEERVQINFSYPMPGRDRLSFRERVLQTIGIYILGGSTRSLLYNKLRHDLGLVYGASAGRTLSFKFGDIGMYLSTSLPKSTEAYREALGVLSDFKKKGVSKEMFERAKKYRELRMQMFFDSPGGICSYLKDDIFWYRRLETLKEWVKIIRSAKQSEIIEIFEKYTSSEPRVLVMAKEDPKLL